MRRRGRAAVAGLGHLAGGLGTAVLAVPLLVVLVGTALLCALGVGLLLVPVALRALRALADAERARLSGWGPDVVGAGPAPARLRDAVHDVTTRRELRWLGVHATLGLLVGVVGVLPVLFAVRDVTMPLWWWLVPRGEAVASLGTWTVNGWSDAVVVALIGLGWCAVTVATAPALGDLQAWPGRRLLPPDARADLPLRVVELTATRAAALDAHGTELRRIERSLHDGAQNRLVAVTVLIGAARRALVRDPATVDAALEQAQAAAEQALHELRAVARSILPPVLADRGLAGSLTGLAAACPVPCRVSVDVPSRCAASVEATAYFVVAEALTNVSRHSRASHAAVRVETRRDRLHLEVTDDGCGGAEEGAGSGMSGMRHRVAAHDGTLTLTSPPGGPTRIEVDLPCGS